jgi:predicted RNase H-like HicB family nuclease
MAKANIKELEKLHKLITEYYGETISEALDNGEELSSGFLGAVNTHLKNNDITVDIVESSPMQNLTYRIQDILKQEEEVM